MVHINGSSRIHPHAAEESKVEEVALSFCEPCAEEYQRSRIAHSLFPSVAEEPITEQLRIMSVTPEHTVLRVVRTDIDDKPEDWSVLTVRLPESAWIVGDEITVTLTPSELDWLRGLLELE